MCGQKSRLFLFGFEWTIIVRTFSLFFIFSKFFEFPPIFEIEHQFFEFFWNKNFVILKLREKNCSKFVQLFMNLKRKMFSLHTTSYTTRESFWNIMRFDEVASSQNNKKYGWCNVISIRNTRNREKKKGIWKSWRQTTKSSLKVELKSELWLFAGAKTEGFLENERESERSKYFKAAWMR